MKLKISFIFIIAVLFLSMCEITYAADKLADGEKCGEIGEATKCAGNCASGYAITDVDTTSVEAGVSVENHLVCGKTTVSGGFKYPLLEAIPGFYARGDTSTDFPGLILSIYKFGIWTVGIAGLFMLVIGGFMYMGSAGNTSVAGSAKNIITDALLGIVAAMLAYLVLYVINPDLTTIDISFASKVVLAEEEDVEVSGTMSSALTARDNMQLDSSFVSALDRLKSKGVYAKVTSGLRSLEKQKELIIKNCGGFPATTRKCSPTTCLLRNGPSSCPHTTGRAADIWATISPGGSQALTQAQCLSNINACFNNKYQKALIEGMRAEGFCVLATEPWHFEKPKMSKACN